ncbi:MAG: hypothetical protein SNJ69_09235, partial [Chloroflexaceae bacterium]
CCLTDLAAPLPPLAFPGAGAVDVQVAHCYNRRRLCFLPAPSEAHHGMGIFSYLTTADPAFGPLAWTFFIVQILG